VHLEEVLLDPGVGQIGQRGATQRRDLSFEHVFEDDGCGGTAL
jgi:hypothetical protein